MWWLDVLGSLGWAVGGFTIGRGFKRRNKAPEAPKLRPCSCGHGFGFHKDGGRCKWYRAPYTTQCCMCQKFDGEVPVDLYARM